MHLLRSRALPYLISSSIVTTSPTLSNRLLAPLLTPSLMNRTLYFLTYFKKKSPHLLYYHHCLNLLDLIQLLLKLFDSLDATYYPFRKWRYLLKKTSKTSILMIKKAINEYKIISIKHLFTLNLSTSIKHINVILFCS